MYDEKLRFYAIYIYNLQTPDDAYVDWKDLFQPELCGTLF